MACFDIYRDQLATLKHGYPLWEPNPGGLYPSVEVGDVGYVRDGLFNRLFSILLHPDDPSQNRGVPENFQVLHLTDPKVTRRDLPKGLYPSRSVFEIRAEAQAQSRTVPLLISGEVSLQCSQQQGAALAIFDHALREDVCQWALFRRYIIKHCESWFAFSNELGLGLEMEDLILVTGRDLASYWAVASFSQSQAEATLALGPNTTIVSGSASLNVAWTKGRHVNHNHGSITRRLAPGMTEVDPDRKDQCIFVRGFRAKRRFLRFPKVLKAAAEPRGDSSHDSPDGDVSTSSILSSQDGSMPSSGSSDVGSCELSCDLGNILLEPLAGAAQAAPDMTMAMLDYILDNSASDMAVVHDSQLYPFLAQTELQTSGFDSVRSVLSHSRPQIFMLEGGAASISHEEIRADSPAWEATSMAELTRRSHPYLPDDWLTQLERILPSGHNAAIGRPFSPYVGSTEIPPSSRPPTPPLSSGASSVQSSAPPSYRPSDRYGFPPSSDSSFVPGFYRQGPFPKHDMDGRMAFRNAPDITDEETEVHLLLDE